MAKLKCLMTNFVMINLLIILLVANQCILHSYSKCGKNPVIFNFGDSNSDTGGVAAALGYNFVLPDGRTFFHYSTGRLCDGRLIIDFLCESLNTAYLSPYLESLGSNFTNGANFAIGGAATLPRSTPFNLHVQVSQFVHFRTRSILLKSKGVMGLLGEEDFKNGLYIIDIGQNDVSAAFTYLSLHQVIDKIPSFISEIKDAFWTIYGQNGKNFWVHNTGPLGCLPEKLATTSKNNDSDVDEYGCIKSINEGAKVFNDKLRDLCDELRIEMKNVTIVYVDIYTIKYDLIANSATYGFEKALTACCGFGGGAYNYSPNVTCLGKGYNVCAEGRKYVSWDGVHYTEAANAFVASKILLSANYSTPPLNFDYFCNTLHYAD